MPNDGPILNCNKRLYGQSLNNIFATHVEKINSDPEKIKFIIPRSKVIHGKPLWE